MRGEETTIAIDEDEGVVKKGGRKVEAVGVVGEG
jgi:hypothetical protein